MNPIIENVSFDGEQYTFANNPIGLTADDLYAAMIGFWTGGILGGGSDTIVDVSTTARLNIMMGNVRQNGESMGVSDRNIRLAQDLTLLTKQNVSFTQGQTQVNADGSIAINKDSATPMQDVVAVMKGMGLLSTEKKSKAQNQNTQTQAYTYEQLKSMSGSQVKAAYAEMVSKYAETLKKIGFTDEQVKGYVHEALKTKTAENRISSVMRLQEEMGLGTELSVDENVLQSDEPNGTMQEKNVSDIPSASKQSIRRFSEEELEFSHRNIDEFVAENKSFEEVLDDYAAVYSEKVNSNVDWSWNKSIPNGDSLSIKQKKSIKDSAVRNNYIPDVKVQKIDGLRYGFADFKSANVVKEIKNLPEDMWKFSDAKQFDWLDDQLGGHIDGYTWHHTEVPGQMELVPTGLHNIITHNGGRTKGFWAYGQR